MLTVLAGCEQTADLLLPGVRQLQEAARESAEDKQAEDNEQQAAGRARERSSAAAKEGTLAKRSGSPAAANRAGVPASRLAAERTGAPYPATDHGPAHFAPGGPPGLHPGVETPAPQFPVAADAGGGSAGESPPAADPYAAPDVVTDAPSPAGATLGGGAPMASAREAAQAVFESPQADDGVFFHLTTGVALAQTLPTGTAMGFSVDYRLARGAIHPDAEYYWVIASRSQGKAVLRGRPDRQGALRTFVSQFRPEHGPFETYLEEVYAGARRRVSKVLPLR